MKELKAITLLYFDSDSPEAREIFELADEGFELLATEAFCKHYMALITPNN